MLASLLKSMKSRSKPLFNEISKYLGSINTQLPVILLITTKKFYIKLLTDFHYSRNHTYMWCFGNDFLDLLHLIRRIVMLRLIDFIQFCNFV